MNSTNNIRYTADLKAYYNYYAFGMLQAGRHYKNPDDYNFGFGGQMRDDKQNKQGDCDVLRYNISSQTSENGRISKFHIPISITNLL